MEATNTTHQTSEDNNASNSSQQLTKEQNSVNESKQEIKGNARNFRVLSPSQQPIKPVVVDDSFFSMSGAELKEHLKSQDATNASNSILQTKEMREKNKKVRKYEKVIIRFRFPDRIEVEATFLPSETAEHMVQFLKENVLVSPETPFYLFLTPPIQKLVGNKTLEGHGLVPTSVVHFSYEKNIQKPPTTFLKPEVLESAIEKKLNVVEEKPTETKEEKKEEAPAAKKGVSIQSLLMKGLKKK
eukprot:TRINITY_DN3067_c0_g1_i1.p1 TRINITY_DN3067_c0_g1~~TRINITY_DN3067_c0_g1_i1.p1  ORF type:complete len:243 (-),score=106.16 TRINITY_DN3067_c0_g1_i1:27-755(-)